MCCITAGGKGNNTTKIVIITISSIAVVVVVVFLFCLGYQKFYGKNKGQGGKILSPACSMRYLVLLLLNCHCVFLMKFSCHVEESQEILFQSSDGLPGTDLIDISMLERNDNNSREVQYFNLSTIQAATNNFSDANKLGEGGFGPVYKVRRYIIVFIRKFF